MRYDVVIVGFRLNASLKPAQALQLVLGMDAETSKELTRRFPANVLTGVSLSRAERVSAELTDAGAKVEVRESRLSLASDGGAGSSASSQADRPPVIAELPDGSRRAPPRIDRHDEASGNYEIGEILAPLGRGGAAQAPAPAAVGGRAQEPASPPASRRASREELDQALRDSLRPNQAAASEPAPPPKQEKPAAAPRPAAREPKPAPTAEPLEVTDNSAFAGMQNFGGGLDGFDGDDSPPLQVDEVALRSIQRRPEPAAQAASLKPALAARLGSWWSRLTEPALEWGAALLSLLVVAGITVLAVGYALDPEHLLRPIGLETLPANAKKLFADLFGG